MRNPGFMGKLLRSRRAIVFVVLFALMPLAFGGCYGRFPLTRKVHQFNEDVHENKWVQTIVMWVFIIVPVYSLSTLADAIIFNAVEFWGGEPLMEETAYVDPDGTRVALAPTDDPNEAVLTISREGNVIAQERFVRVSDTLVEVRSADGELRGSVVSTGGGYTLNDSNGVPISFVPATPASM